MFGNDDYSSNVEINVNRGGNGMSDGTVTIGVSEYKEILELAYKAAVLQDVLFAHVELGYQGKSLFFMASTAMDTIARFIFPDRYAEKLAELVEKKRADDERDRLCELMSKKAEDGKEGTDNEH